MFNKILICIFVFAYIMPTHADELFFNKKKCMYEKDPQGIFTSEQFYFCNIDDSPKDSILIYFLDSECPKDFDRQLDFDLYTEDNVLSACSPLIENWFNLYRSHPNIIGFFEEKCPQGSLEIAGTNSVKFCN